MPLYFRVDHRVASRQIDHPRLERLASAFPTHARRFSGRSGLATRLRGCGVAR
jgi:hypothetical protein